MTDLDAAIARMTGIYNTDKEFEEHIATKNLWGSANRSPYDRNALKDLYLILEAAKAHRAQQQTQDVNQELVEALRELCDALVDSGYGLTSNSALPAEYDTAREILAKHGV